MSSPASDPRRRNAIPVIHTSGSYYDVGFDVGRTFRSLIQEYLGSLKMLDEYFLPAYESKEGRAAYDVTLACLMEACPHYVRELQGTADGAQVPFHHLLLLHMDEIVPMAAEMRREKKFPSVPTGCSSLSINKEGQVLLGHTEDARQELLNYVYIVSARIYEEPRDKLAARDERFTALCYAGYLPGFCMGYNHHGLVFSVNVICPKRVLAGKMPRHFICRELLSANSEEAAHRILQGRDTAVSADGFTINMVLVRPSGDYVFQNVEVGPAEHGDENPVSIVTLSLGEHHLHTNIYLRLTHVEEKHLGDMCSSKHRHDRAAQLPAPRDRRDLLQLLSDTQDPKFPFFREGSDHDPGRTVALGVFDILKRTWAIWMKNPRAAEPVVEMPLLFTWNT